MAYPFTGNTTDVRTITSAASGGAANGTTKAAQAAVSGRAAALQSVYDAHVEQIYRFVYFKVGNREDAEDITSQVFIKAAQSLDVGQPEQTMLAWLYQVARTTITDHWRHYYRGVTTSLDEMEEDGTVSFAADPIFAGGEEIVETEPAVEKVKAVLGLLPENYRRVLELRFLHGCSLKETAAAMHITEANAKVIQHRAIQKAMKVGAQLI